MPVAVTLRIASTHTPPPQLDHRISTGNPRFRVSRERSLRLAASAVDPASPVARVLPRIYNNSRIDSRYFCVPDFADSEMEEEVAESGEWGDTSDDLPDGRIDGGGGQASAPPVDKFYPEDGR